MMELLGIVALFAPLGALVWWLRREGKHSARPNPPNDLAAEEPPKE